MRKNRVIIAFLAMTILVMTTACGKCFNSVEPMTDSSTATVMVKLIPLYGMINMVMKYNNHIMAAKQLIQLLMNMTVEIIYKKTFMRTHMIQKVI